MEIRQSAEDYLESILVLSKKGISPCVVAQGTCFDRKKDDWKGKMQEWSGKRDSNPQPSAWKADALAVELFPHPRCALFCRSAN